MALEEEEEEEEEGEEGMESGEPGEECGRLRRDHPDVLVELHDPLDPGEGQVLVLEVGGGHGGHLLGDARPEPLGGLLALGGHRRLGPHHLHQGAGWRARYCEGLDGMGWD